MKVACAKETTPICNVVEQHLGKSQNNPEKLSFIFVRLCKNCWDPGYKFLHGERNTPVLYARHCGNML